MNDDLSIKDLKEIIDKGNSEKIQEILIKYKELWNTLIKETEKVMLRGIELQDADLSGLDLSGTVIEDSDLSGADLSRTDLSDAVIIGTDLSKSSFYKANLEGTRITQTSLAHSEFYGAKTEKMYLTGSVDLYNVSVEYATSPERTKRDFREMEYYEHMAEDDESAKSY